MGKGSIASRTAQQPRPAFASNYCMVVRLRGEFSIAELQQALDRLRPRHGRLIPDAGNGDRADFHFPLRLLTGCEEADWKEVVKEELRQPFPGWREPFSRFTLLQSKDYSDLVATFHHGACDGMSGVFVLRDVVHLLGEPAVELPPIPTPPEASRLIPKSATENPSLKRQLWMTVTVLRLTLLVSRLRRRISRRRSTPSAPEAEFSGQELPANQRFCLLTRTLTREQTAALVQRSKAEQATVHAAVCTAWLCSFAGMLAEKKSWIRRVSSPVDLRGRLAAPILDTAGMYMSGVEISLNCAPGRDFWQTAREYNKKFGQASASGRIFMLPLMFQAFAKRFSGAEMAEVAGAVFNRPVKYDFSVTNLGRLDFPDRVGSLRIEAIHNLVNSSEYERTVGVNTFNGRMTFILMFRESKMDPRAGKILLDRAIERLAKASGDEWQPP